MIFTDFSMPEMDGIEITKEIRNFLTNEMKIPVQLQPAIIGVTGHVEDQFKSQGLEAGMNEV
jgi:CheY-like chemotaxis protein